MCSKDTVNNRIRRKFSLLLVLILLTQTAFQESGLVILADEMLPNFPEGITFRLELESDKVIEKVTLIYSSDIRTCQSNTARKDIEFDPDTALSLEWEWDFSRAGTLPPGAGLEWQWEITDISGTTSLTEPKNVVLLDQRNDWQRISAGGITVEWYVGDGSFGAELHQIALESLNQVRSILGIVDNEEIWITVYPSPNEVQEAVKFTSEWAGGLAFPNHNTMIIAGLPGDVDWFNSVIPHELTHILIDNHTFNCQGAWMPTWFNEGMAYYSEYVMVQEDRDLLSEANQSNSIPRLSSLVIVFSQDSDEALLDYLVSSAAVEYLILEYGSEKMAELLEQLGSGEMIDPALEKIYGLDTDRLDVAWRKNFGFEVEDIVPDSEVSPATDTPLPTIALWTSAVQITATSTITPQQYLQLTSTPEVTAEPTITPTNFPEDNPLLNTANQSTNTTLVIVVIFFVILLLAGLIIVLRRRVL
jgi:hypothetical protein